MNVLYELEVKTTDNTAILFYAIAVIIYLGILTVCMIIKLIKDKCHGYAIYIKTLPFIGIIVVSAIVLMWSIIPIIAIDQCSYTYQVVEWDMKNVDLTNSDFEIVQVIGDNQYIIRTQTVFLKRQEQVSN